MSKQKQTHCKKGHLLEGDNVYVNPTSGKRCCNVCKTEQGKEYSKNNAEKERTKARKWQKENPEKYRANVKRHYIKSLGWSEKLQQERLEQQQNKCAICERMFDENNPPQRDHEHIDPPIPRGLLCRECNGGLGMFKDSTDLLIKAVEYLRICWQRDLPSIVVKN